MAAISLLQMVRSGQIADLASIMSSDVGDVTATNAASLAVRGRR